MIRSPQHLVLQLSVAPCRRTLSTVTTTSSSSPPPPSAASFHRPDTGPPSSASVASSVSIPVFPVSPLSSLTPAPPVSVRSSATTARAASVAIRALRMATDSTDAAQRRQQQRSHSEDRAPSEASSTYAQPPSRFPLGYKEAIHQWWECNSASTAEHNVLDYVPYIRQAKPGSQPDLSLPQGDDGSGASLGALHRTAEDPYGTRVWRSQMVPLSGKNRALNEYSIERVGEETTDTLVILHGYGAGLGFFYRNFEPLSRFTGWRLYALDLLGMGNSSRPPFKIHAKEPQAKITEAENWFIDALEEWRKIRKVERFTLMGHSMGGYLATAYALKYPGHINKLILASPVGVPEDPYAVNADMPEPEESSLATEFAQDQNAVVEGYSQDESVAAAAPRAHNNNKSNKPQRRPLPGWLIWLWDANVSPFSLVRASGPLGPRLVSAWTSRRFSHLQPDQAEALHRYTYSLFRQRGSGEYVLPYVLAPGAHARRPLINRIQNVGRQVIRPAQAATATAPAKPAVREAGIPIVMMYGDHDWMDVTGGFAAQEKIKSRTLQALLHGTADEKRRENGSAKVIVVRNAGHHLYLDNAEEFNGYVQKELRDTQQSERRLRNQLADSLA